MKEPTFDGLPNRDPEQNKDTVFFGPAKILDGKGAKNLMESMKSFRFPSGENVIVGTDMGINYKIDNPHNEDRVVVVPSANFIAVVDGMGGMGHGELAAEILAKNLLASPISLDGAVVSAKKEMKENNVGNGGAVFISARIVEEQQQDRSVIKFLDVYQLGDAKLIIIKKDGAIIFESVDDSLIQELIVGGHLTPDQALHDKRRNVVLQAVSPNKDDQPKFYPNIKVEEGDIVLLMSDGISDNITAEEIAEERQKQNLTAKGLFTWISDTTNARMAQADEIIEKGRGQIKDIEGGLYSDQFKSKPKPDNRALAIMEIK